MTAAAGLPEVVREATGPEALSTEMPSGRTTGWWGMVMFVRTSSGAGGHRELCRAVVRGGLWR